MTKEARKAADTDEMRPAEKRNTKAVHWISLILGIALFQLTADFWLPSGYSAIRILAAGVVGGLSWHIGAGGAAAFGRPAEGQRPSWWRRNWKWAAAGLVAVIVFVTLFGNRVAPTLVVAGVVVGLSSALVGRGPDPLDTMKLPWRPRVSSVIGLFFGPVSAALVTFINLRRLGSSHKAGLVLHLTLGGSVIYGIAYLIPITFGESEVLVWGILANSVSLFLYPLLQKREFDEWVAGNPGLKTSNGWRATGWCLVGYAALHVLHMIGGAPWIEW